MRYLAVLPQFIRIRSATLTIASKLSGSFQQLQIPANADRIRALLLAGDSFGLVVAPARRPPLAVNPESHALKRCADSAYTKLNSQRPDPELIFAIMYRPTTRSQLATFCNSIIKVYSGMELMELSALTADFPD